MTARLATVDDRIWARAEEDGAVRDGSTLSVLVRYQSARTARAKCDRLSERRRQTQGKAGRI